jgi:hypothetical protein
MGVALYISKCRRQRVKKEKKKKKVFGAIEHQPELQHHIMALAQGFNHCFPDLIPRPVGLWWMYKYTCIIASYSLR